MPNKKLKWAVGNVTCEKCGYGWVAVRPVKTKRLKCPKCGRMGVKLKNVETGGADG